MLETLKPWIQPTIVLAVAIALGYLSRGVFVHRMAALSLRTKTILDDLLVGACRRHIPFWFLLAGLALAGRRAPLSPELLGTLDLVLADALILSLTLVGANLVNAWIESSTARVAEGSMASSSLLRNVVRGAILTVGILVVIHKHRDITPILGALGIGSLAVALGLQPTLSNLFAGLHITLAKSVRIGDFVELENGVQGFVADIGWRATQLREPLNNLVIVPNARLVEMIAQNYSLPQMDQTIVLQMGVAYGSDLAKVEAVTVAAATEVVRAAPEAVADFTPVVRFNAFGESSINFALVFRVKQFVDRGAVIHELVKRLKARYEQEGIEIPFPQRVVHQARA
jgi:small-conductance mechanosensitive channel